MQKQELRERFGELSVFDVHEHFESYDATHDYDWPRFLYQNSYLNLFAAEIPQSVIKIMDDPGVSEKNHFQALLEIAEYTKHTVCGRFLRRLAARCGVELRADSFEAFDAYFHTRTPQSIEAQTPAIKATLANSLGHPLYGYCRGIKEYLEKPPKRPESMRIQLCVTPLHCVHSLSELSDLEYVYGEPITSLAAWEKAVQAIIERSMDIGIAGFKDIYMFYRPFDIEKPDGASESQFAKLLKGERAGRALLDTMLYKTYALMSETGLTAAVHTGCSISTCESAMCLRPLIALMQTYPLMRFDLLHLNYPKIEDYMVALKSCPNAYANCSWVPTFDREYSLRFLRQAVDALPISRVSLFGGDRHCPGEPVAVALELTLELLAQAFHELVGQGSIISGDALEIARAWLYDNPIRLYGV